MKSRVLVCLLLWVSKPQAQEHFSHNLDSVEVISQRIRPSVSVGKDRTWVLDDDAYLATHSLEEVLSEATGTFVKSYGIGSLATSSIRGGNASHTLVLWNGLPIHSPMLGQLDLSLLSIDFMDHLSFQPGGSTGVWGNGAIAGVLSLTNKTLYSDRLSFKAKIQIGSFGQHSQNIQIAAGARNWQSTTRLINRFAENNFKYRRAPGSSRIRLEHAELSQQGLMQSLSRKMGRNMILDLHLWHQTTNREIPALLTQTKSLASQNDRTTRIMGSLSRQKNRSTTRLKMAFFHEENEYQDALINIRTRNRFSTMLTEAVHEISVTPTFKALVGSTHSYVKATTAAYNMPVSEYRASIFLTSIISFKKVLFQSSLRQSFIDGRTLPLVPALALQIPLTKKINLGTKVSRDYRAPTLNDRFWTPGGNQDLKAENGWSQEISVKYTSQRQKLKYDYHVTLFSRKIDDWILWSPGDGNVFWSAQNLSKVWSRGIEQAVDLRYDVNDFLKIEIGINYTLLKSTNLIPIAIPKLERGQQLVYTPEEEGSIGIGFSLCGNSIKYQHMMTGAYQGINMIIPSYSIGKVQMSKHVKLKSINTITYLAIDNLWNADYQVIENRPMPPTNFRMGVQFKFQ